MSGIKTTVSPNKWSFNQEVTDVFDDMLERSIPQYTLMRESVNNLAKEYIKAGTTIVDLGCSRGTTLFPLVYEYDDRYNFIGCDVSEPMLKACREQFMDKKNVSIKHIDLRNDFPYFINREAKASVIFSILTIQFTPIEYRLQILKNIYDNLLEGGCFIFVEKVIGNTASLDKHFKQLYWKMKKSNGYTEEQITRKALSLEGVLVPVTAKWNEEMLRTSGFTQIDCFWRWMNFAGWIAVK